MKKTLLSILLITVCIFAPLFAQGAAEATKTEGPTKITIWHDNDPRLTEAVEEVVNAKLTNDDISVVFEKKANLTDNLKLYGGTPEGPDMYLFAHDSLGGFVAMDILSPIENFVDASLLDNFIPMTINAGKIAGKQYLLPLYFETLVMIYNKDLWKGDFPLTTEELYEYMLANTDGDNYAVVNQHSNAYNVSPFIYGFGAYIINEDGEPGLNSPEMIDAVKYNNKFAKLEADGDYNTVTTLFNEKKAAAIIGGPWLIPGIKEAGINYGIVPLSDIKLPNGNGLSPFSGVQSIGILKNAEMKKDSIAKVLECLASPEVGIALAEAAGCAPASSKAYENEAVSSNELIAAIKKTSSTSIPMPNIPEMGAMWGPTEGMLAAINKNNADIKTSCDNAQKQALQAIQDMR